MSFSWDREAIKLLALRESSGDVKGITKEGNFQERIAT
jgi:hypothetical protein